MSQDNLRHAQYSSSGMQVDDPLEIFSYVEDSGQGTIVVGGSKVDLWTPDNYLQQVNQITKEIREAHARVVADWVPTHYCDLSSTINGAGTLQSPYQPSQLAAIFTGRKKSVTLGLKRGSVYRGTLALGSPGVGGVGGDALDGEFFQIVPYGDHPRLPMIVASRNVTTWTQVESGIWSFSLSGYANQSTAERDVFQNNVRLLRVTSLANLRASAGGTMFNVYSAGTLTIYIKPFLLEDPNLGQMEITDNNVGFTLAVFADGTRTGNVQIHGLHVCGSLNSAILVVCNAAAKGVVVNGCVTGNTGCDYVNGLGMDGIIVNGYTDAARLTQLGVQNNYAYNVGNNAVELSYVGGGVVEKNFCRNHRGAGIVEMWNSVSNVKVRRNRSVADPLFSYGQTLGSFANCGFWSAGQTDGDAIDAGGTKNINNEFTFNLVQDAARLWKFVSGTGQKVFHNTHFIKNPRGAPGLSNFEGGVTQGANTLTITHSNNLYICFNASDGYQFMNISQVAHIAAGNNNYYMSPLGSCSLRIAGSTKFALEDWVTALGGTIDSAAKVGPGLTGTPATWAVDYSQVLVDNLGVPAGTSALRGKGLNNLTYTENGVTLQYTMDCFGSPVNLTAPTVGACS